MLQPLLTYEVNTNSITPSPGWSKPVVIKPDPEVEPPRRRVRAREIKIAVEPLRERVSEMMGRILREEETSRSDEGDKQRT